MSESRPAPPSVAPTRRQARERALSLLYEAEAKSISPRELLATLPVEPARFAAELLEGVDDHAEQIDGYISRFARGWAIDRMPALDRALLRLAVFELLHRPDVPTAAILSEAVDLAGRYSTDESSRFVNGVLGEIGREVRPDS